VTLVKRALEATAVVNRLAEIGMDWESAGPNEAMGLRRGLEKAILELKAVHSALWPFPDIGDLRAEEL
jgi:hypothetical protein